MEKTKKVVLTTYNVLRILSKIAFIFCIIGAVFSLIALLMFANMSEEVLMNIDFSDPDIASLLSVIDIGQIPSFLTFIFIFTLLICIASAVISKFSELYFGHTLDRRTPFTLEGSSEMLRLGIIMIAVNIALGVIVGIIYGIFTKLYNFPQGLNFNTDVTMGVFVILLSFVFKYATEVIIEKSEKIVDEPNADGFGTGSENQGF
jgi:hypothetical protein